jgi:hypothetical protein
MAAPLLMGNDLRNLDPKLKDILTAKEVIAVRRLCSICRVILLLGVIVDYIHYCILYIISTPLSLDILHSLAAWICASPDLARR